MAFQTWQTFEFTMRKPSVLLHLWQTNVMQAHSSRFKLLVLGMWVLLPFNPTMPARQRQHLMILMTWLDSQCSAEAKSKLDIINVGCSLRRIQQVLGSWNMMSTASQWGLIHQILLRWSSSIFRWVTFEREDPHHGLQVEACASSSVNHLAIWQTGVTSNAWPNQTTCLKSLRVNCRHRISKEFCWAFNSHDVHFFGGTKIFLVFVAMRLLLHTRFLSKVH